MPPRWPTPPTREDPNYRKLDDRFTLAAHAMAFAASISGLTFVKLLRHAEWSWYAPFALTWLALVAVNGIWVLAIARYPGSTPKGSADVSPGGSS